MALDCTKQPCELCQRREELGNCGDCRAGIIMQNGYVMACQHCRLFATDDDALSAAWALLEVLQHVYAEGPGHPSATVADALDELKNRAGAAATS